MFFNQFCVIVVRNHFLYQYTLYKHCELGKGERNEYKANKKQDHYSVGYVHDTILWWYGTESEITEGAGGENLTFMLFMFLGFYFWLKVASPIVWMNIRTLGGRVCWVPTCQTTSTVLSPRRNVLHVHNINPLMLTKA